tara:strand:+ start:43 stop:252 length:210 start_codon:yes stop_codon:yes gene_type:complete
MNRALNLNRSITRDVKTMSLGLDRINKEIDHLSSKKQDKSIRNRLARLKEARKHLTENPEKVKELTEKL